LLQKIVQAACEENVGQPVVFLTPQKRPYTKQSFGAALKRAGKKAGIGSIGLHVLRHMFASRLVMAGVDLRTVQDLMGHANMTIRYARPTPDHRRAARVTLENREESPSNFHNTPPAVRQKVQAIR